MVALVGVLYADAADDLQSAKSDFATLQSSFDTVKSDLSTYLDASRNLRAMDDADLNLLIERICSSDIEHDGDDAEKLATEMEEHVQEQVRSAYDDTTDKGAHVYDEIGKLEGDAKSLRGRVKQLEGNDDTKDAASDLGDQIDRVEEQVERMFDKLDADRRTLENVKNGVMLGANNATLRARMDYGKRKHLELQSSYGCDASEMVLSSGRPDCVKFDQDHCQVIEFKPDSWDTDSAKRQAESYVDDVRAYFKDDERAKRCVQSDRGAEYEAVGVTYTRCKP